MKKKLFALFLGAVLLPLAGMCDSTLTQPVTLTVQIGKSSGLNYFVRSIAARPRMAAYIVKKGGSTDDVSPIVFEVSEKKWRAFRQTLDDLNVWAWPKSCDGPYTFDITYWTVKIHYADRTIESSGSNSYPIADGTCNGLPEVISPDSPAPKASEDFNIFLKAVRDLTGKDFQ